MYIENRKKLIFISLLLSIISLLAGIKGSIITIGIIFASILVYIILYKEKLTIYIIILSMINLNYFKLPAPINNIDVLFSTLFIVTSLFKFIAFKNTVTTKVSISMYIYILVCSISLINTPVFIENVMGIIRYIYYLMIIQYIINMKINEADIINILKISVLSMIIPVITSVYQLITGTGARILEDVGGNFTRAFALTSHPSVLAHYLLIVISMTYVFKIDTKNKEFNYKYRILWFLGIVILAFTFTRSIITALFLGLMLYYIYIRDWKVTLIPIVFIIILNLPGVGDRFLELFDLKVLLTNSSFYWRLLQWNDVLQLITPENFLIGQGYKSVLYYTKYTTHNEYLNLLVENGFIGFMVFIYIIFTMLTICVKLLKKLDKGIYKSYILSYMITLFLCIILAFNENNFSIPSSITYLWIYSGIMLNIYGKEIKQIRLIW